MAFLVFSYLPLPAGALWSHVARGEAMLSQESLLVDELTDAMLPLAEGVSLPQASWLSEVILGGAHRLAGPSGLAALFTLVSFATLLLLAAAFYLQTRRKRWVAVGTLLTLTLAWGLASALRVETFGFFCLAALLFVLVAGGRWQRVMPRAEHEAERELGVDSHNGAGGFACWLWVAIPLLTVVWANLGSSFVVGLVVLAAWAAGEIFDRARAVGLRAALAHAPLRRRVFLTELSLAVTLINPYGVDLWLASVGLLPGNSGLAGGRLVPLVFMSFSGVMLACVLLLAAAMLRLSPRSLSGSTVALFVGGAVAAAIHVPWLLWFAPVAAVLLLPHLAEAAGVLPCAAEDRDSVLAPEEAAEAKPATFQFAYTLVCGLLIWTGFALSPLATPILGGKPRSLEQLHSSEVPLAVVAWLQEQPSQLRLAWAPAEWGDYLAYQQGIPVFANALLDAMPRQVQNDYFLISRGDNWQSLADRYAIDLIVADKAQTRRLAAAVRRAEGNDWQLVYEDESVVIARRVNPTAAIEQAPSFDPSASAASPKRRHPRQRERRAS